MILFSNLINLFFGLNIKKINFNFFKLFYLTITKYSNKLKIDLIFYFLDIIFKYNIDLFLTIL